MEQMVPEDFKEWVQNELQSIKDCDGDPYDVDPYVLACHAADSLGYEIDNHLINWTRQQVDEYV